MKKIIYLGGFCMPDRNAAAQRVLGIAKILSVCGYEISFYGLTHSYDPLTDVGNIEGFNFINFPYPDRFDKWIRYLSGRDNLFKALKKENPDMVILYNHPAFAIEHILRYCHPKGIKVIADVTEWYEPYGNILFKIIKGYDSRRRMYKSHLKLDGIICISSFLSSFYKNLGLKIVEIPPLVDCNERKWKISNTEYIYSHDSIESINVIYAGSPDANKDRLDIILKSMDKVWPAFNNKIKFDIIGITEEQYRHQWNDQKFRDYVYFHGRKTHNEVIKFLLKADYQIFIRPDTIANRAGFPTKFVETLTSKTIPITNLSSNLSMYLHDKENGFIIDSLNTEAICDTLRIALSKSHKEINKIKSNIKTDTFDYHNYILQLKEFCQDILVNK